MSYYSTPCSALKREQLIKRLADYLDKSPEVALEAGKCQVCGHALPIAYRAVRVQPDGTTETRECPTGDPVAAEFEAKVREHTLKNYDESGWIYFRQCACDAFGAEHSPLGKTVWQEARAELKQRQDERRRLAAGRAKADREAL